MDMEKDNKESKQFVLFDLADQVYGVEISDVQIIEKPKPLVRVPKAPACVKGVMNLRGDIIPVIDIRKLFEMETEDLLQTTRIVIVKVENALIGILVDAVREVLELAAHQVENVQSVKNLNHTYISGIGKVQEGSQIITILNLKNIIEDAFGLVKNG